ncbi:terminase small subunit [Cognatiluteimonas weifangensis]|uniref:Terminase small subunit n=1 Tax=Cognatiluteimonas weifangensis TaxID=2303539 RepID=A0A372DNF1_9GAMM|nr:terminase small subunit [Luteimonas weifangensis]RFP61111.1 hypothetical protein D0Y53_05095 [Luteimonas weifangensis]
MATQLTQKQRTFAENKAAGMTNRDAAIAAGYAVAAADATGYKLTQHPGVRAEIKAATKGTPTVDTKSSMPAMPRKHYDDAKQFLLDAMNLASLPIAVRGDYAKALLPYQHARMGETGKKEKAKDRAREIARNGRHKFATKQPPQLHVVKNTD